MLLWRLQQYIRDRRRLLDNIRLQRTAAHAYLGKLCTIDEGYLSDQGIVVELGWLGIRFVGQYGRERYIPLAHISRFRTGLEAAKSIVVRSRYDRRPPPEPILEQMRRLLPADELPAEWVACGVGPVP